MIKRLFDILGSVIGLALVSPVLLLSAIAIKLESSGPALFVQERIGQGFRAFSILKLRSMKTTPVENASQITVRGDVRVTRVGHILRKTKIDELPQLINVLRGDMSLVGPRPEVQKYVEMFRVDYEEILRVRPGITDLASIRYRDEESLLGMSADPEREYVEVVLPEKIRLAKEYVRNSSLLFDALLLVHTLVRVVRKDEGRMSTVAKLGK